MMRGFILLLVAWCVVPAWGQEFNCGFFEPEGLGATGAVGTIASDSDYWRGTVRPLILFGKFRGAADESLTGLKDREGMANQSMANFLDADHEGSLAHYFNEMSYGSLTLSPPADGIQLKWYESDHAGLSGYNITTGPCKRSIWRAGVEQFVGEVLDNADASLDFSQYDGNGDGVVDLILFVTPSEFGNTCNYHGTPIDNINKTLDGVTLERVITSDYRSSMPFFTAVFAHEYGHTMGLPELYDRTHQDSDTEPEPGPEKHSAGIGLWGVMGRLNWPHVDNVSSGANLLSAYSRAQVEWITATNTRLETITSDRLNISIYDINSTDPGKEGKVYKIPVNNSDSEYFLVSNRQNKHSERTSIGSYYEDFATGSGGLAIWHIDEHVRRGRIITDVNEYERHKRVDLECADGLFSDKGFPSDSSDSVSGGDNLDYWSDNATYRTRHNGNNADTMDLWDGITYKHFRPDTNPSTHGYEAGGKPETKKQNVFSGIYIENISRIAGSLGAMTFDVRFAPRAPNYLDAAVGEDRVELSWDPPLANGSTIASYKVRHRLSTESRWTDTLLNDSSARTHTVTGLTQDNEYTFEVLAVSAMQGSKEGKEGAAAGITATPQRAILGPESVEFSENGTDIVARYEKSGSFTRSSGSYSIYESGQGRSDQ